VGFTGENNELLCDKKIMRVTGAKTTLTSVEQPMENQESEVKSAAWKYVEKRTAPERGLRGRLFFCLEIEFSAIC